MAWLLGDSHLISCYYIVWCPRSGVPDYWSLLNKVTFGVSEKENLHSFQNETVMKNLQFMNTLDLIVTLTKVLC